jgi:predicted nucleotidyltransferase
MEEKITNHSFAILSLYRTNYASALHARAMAKKLVVSHVTLLPHLRQLEKSRILRSRKVGKNKEYILNSGNSLVKHYLAIAEELETIGYLNRNFLMKKISDSLSSLNLTGSLTLFGSCAKDYSTETSDVDLFYLGKLEKEQSSEIRNRGKIYGKEINVKTSSIENFQDGLRTGGALIKEIVQKHTVLQNPGPFVDLLWGYYVER